MIFKVNTYDPDVQRKGRILAVVILVIAACGGVLAVTNILLGQHEYNISNVVFLVLVLGLFVVNRLGYVTATCILTVTLIVVGSVVFLSEEDLARTFILMCIPVFIASFLLVVGERLTVVMLPTDLQAAAWPSIFAHAASVAANAQVELDIRPPRPCSNDGSLARRPSPGSAQKN